jgi:hypothetical protein
MQPEGQKGTALTAVCRQGVYMYMLTLRLVGHEDYGCDALTTRFIGSAVSRSRVICS